MARTQKIIRPRYCAGVSFWNVLIGGAAGFLIGGVSSIISQSLDEEAPPINSGEFWGNVGIAVASGAIEGGTLGALSGLIGGMGSASKHLSNSFKRVLNNGNWSYYFTQINTQAIRDGFKAIPGILKATIPSLTKSFFKISIQRHE